MTIQALENDYQNLWGDTSADMGGGMGIEAGGTPSLQSGYPQLIAPQAPTSQPASTAFDIISSGGAGALAGTSAGGWVGTIVGAVLGLAEGIIGAAVGSSSDQRSYNAQLQQFNNQMRSYYEHSNNVIEEMRQRRKEQAKQKAMSRQELERRMKLDAFLVGRKAKEQQRTELAQRWGTPVQRNI